MAIEEKLLTGLGKIKNELTKLQSEIPNKYDDVSRHIDAAKDAIQKAFEAAYHNWRDREG